MNGTLAARDAVYYVNGEKADTIGHIGIVQRDGTIRSLIGNFLLAAPGPHDVVVKVDEIKAFLVKYVAAAKASPYYSQDSGLRRVIDAYEETGHFRHGLTDAKVAVFRQVADGFDPVRRVVFYEYLLGVPAPRTI